MKNTFFLFAILFFACWFSAAALQQELKKNSHMMRNFSSPQLKRPEHKIIFPDNKFYANNKLTKSPTNSFIKPSEFQEFPYQAPDISYYEVTPVALSNGNIMLFWASYDELDFKDDSLYCATSTDGGITWKDKKIILHSPFNSIYYLNGLQTYSGRIIICWTNYTNSAGLTNMTYSVNNGDSWSPVSSISSYYNIAWYPSVAQSLDSSLYLSYSRDVNERYNDIVYRISNDDGLTWGTEKILSDNQTAQNMGSIIPVNGSKLLAFYSRVDNDYGIVKRISYDGGDLWSAETTILDNPGNDDNVRVIRISSDTLYLLYWQWNEPFYDFYYMVSGDNGDTWNEPVQFTKYSGWDGYVSNLCLYHNKPFVAFASDRWQSVYNLPHVWYGSIGIAEDNNPPPAVLNSAAYQYYFVPGKVETILGKFSDESGIQNAQVNLSVNGGAEYSLQMFDDSRHNDWGSEDGIYGVSLGPFMLGDHIDYYFSVTDIDNNTITVKGFTADVVQHSSPVNTNGGFEETRVGAAANEINGWKLYNDSPASGGFEIVDDTIEEGNRALKIEITSLGINPWDIQAVNEPFPVEEKTQYRYFIQAKADKENVKVNFDIEDPSYNAWQSMEANLTTKWQEYSFDFYVPPHSAQARSANWFALKSNSSSLPITLYIDDLRIEKLGTAVSVNDTHSEVPVNFSLNQNYPNPFNPATILSFNIEHKSIVSLKVFDLLGKEIATLVNEEKPAGCYQVQFDASNLSSGVYFYTMEAAGFVQTKKMILLH